jgi:small conductance mechanosensitive channel
VGFGAQNLVRDIINGVEVLVENQYGRGDFVRIRSVTGGSYGGVVEDMNLRRTVLRDVDGSLHFVSHGQVEVASNLTRGYSRLTLNVAVAYSADLDKVFAIIERVGGELAADPLFAARIREAPRALAIDKMGEATVEVRVDAVTEPGEQLAVSGELRRRLKQAFDAEGVKLRD